MGGHSMITLDIKETMLLLLCQHRGKVTERWREKKFHDTFLNATMAKIFLSSG
jgi:hypothetical protein